MTTWLQLQMCALLSKGFQTVDCLIIIAADFRIVTCRAGIYIGRGSGYEKKISVSQLLSEEFTFFQYLEYLSQILKGNSKNILSAT